MVRKCIGFDGALGKCVKPGDHEGLHANRNGETWR